MNHDYIVVQTDGKKFTVQYRCRKCGDRVVMGMESEKDEDYLNTHRGECSEKLQRGKKNDQL